MADSDQMEDGIYALENCTTLQHYDYFSGSEVSFAVSFLALGLVIPGMYPVAPCRSLSRTGWPGVRKMWLGGVLVYCVWGTLKAVLATLKTRLLSRLMQQAAIVERDVKYHTPTHTHTHTLKKKTQIHPHNITHTPQHTHVHTTQNTHSTHKHTHTHSTHKHTLCVCVCVISLCDILDSKIPRTKSTVKHDININNIN